MVVSCMKAPCPQMIALRLRSVQSISVHNLRFLFCFLDFSLILHAQGRFQSRTRKCSQQTFSFMISSLSVGRIPGKSRGKPGSTRKLLNFFPHHHPWGGSARGGGFCLVCRLKKTFHVQYSLTSFTMKTFFLCEGGALCCKEAQLSSVQA